MSLTFSLMEDEYIPQRGVRCLKIKALQLYYGYYVVFYIPDFIQIWLLTLKTLLNKGTNGLSCKRDISV
jgi:hypothetical protein